MEFRCRHWIVTYLCCRIRLAVSYLPPSLKWQYSFLSAETQAKEVPVTSQTQQSSLGCVGWVLDGFSNDTLYIQYVSSREYEIETSAAVNNLDSFETCQMTHCERWKWFEHSQLHCRRGGRDRRLHSNDIPPSSYHSSHHTQHTP